MERIDLPAGTVHYRASGPADGRPVVFVHGFLVDTDLWSDVPDRLAKAGYRTFAPTWPLGAHTTAMKPDADLSPRGIAKVVVSFLEALDLTDVVLVGSDTGGAVSQLVLDEAPDRIGRLVLTNCDAFDTFPPFPFNHLFRLARHERPPALVLQSMRPDVPAQQQAGVRLAGPPRPRRRTRAGRGSTPYLTDAGVRRDVAPLRAGLDRPGADRLRRWLERFDRPVLLCWAPDDPFFKLPAGPAAGAARSRTPTLVEFAGARTFVSLDQPERLADEIVRWLGGAPS